MRFYIFQLAWWYEIYEIQFEQHLPNAFTACCSENPHEQLLIDRYPFLRGVCAMSYAEAPRWWHCEQEMMEDLMYNRVGSTAQHSVSCFIHAILSILDLFIRCSSEGISKENKLNILSSVEN